MIVFPDRYRENDRLHHLALRQICKMCLEDGLPLRFGEINRKALDDAFEDYVLAANGIELEIPDGRLPDCIEQLRQLIIYS